MMTKFTILFLLHLTAFFPVFESVGGDVIYQPEDEPLNCIITEVTEQTIRYKHPENPEGPDYILKKDKALLVFKDNGDFLIPTIEEVNWISGANAEFHKIITQENEILAADFLEVEGANLSFQETMSQEQKQISTEEVLLIIYKDGRHELFAPPNKVAESLTDIGQAVGEFSATTPTVATASVEATTESSSVPPSGDVVVLNDEQKAHFEKLAEVKANDFGKYLRIISNKEEDEEDKLYAIEAAGKLFISDSVKIEVSSVNREEKRQFTVPEYLNRLRILPYDKVELIWMRAQLVSQLRPGQDGKYYGVIAAQQLFRGYLDNEIAYQDVTDKNIEVVLTRYEIFDEGVRKQKWDVFLSDIGVQQTREK